LRGLEETCALVREGKNGGMDWVGVRRSTAGGGRGGEFKGVT